MISRMTRLHRRAIWAALFIATPLMTVGAQAHRLITDTDLFKFVWAADPQISPNGSSM